MRKRIGRPSPALVISCVALFVALGGVGYAAATINGSSLVNKSVAGKKLKNKTVTGGKVKSNTLTGTQVNEAKLGQVPSAAKAVTADKAINADNAVKATTAENSSQLGGIGAGSYRTASAAAEETDDLTLTTSNQNYLETAITLPSERRVMALATIDATADGGPDDDNVNCNLNINGTDGVRLSTNVVEGPAGAFDANAGLSLTQSVLLPAGTYPVVLECSEGGPSNTTITDGALTVWATS